MKSICCHDNFWFARPCFCCVHASLRCLRFREQRRFILHLLLRLFFPVGPSNCASVSSIVSQVMNSSILRMIKTRFESMTFESFFLNFVFWVFQDFSFLDMINSKSTRRATNGFVSLQLDQDFRPWTTSIEQCLGFWIALSWSVF